MHIGQVLINNKKMKNSIIMIICLVLSSISSVAQHVLTIENNVMRPGDVISKVQIDFVAPGESGENAIWDFRNVKRSDRTYRVEYVSDSTATLLSIHPRFMRVYKLLENTLVQVGYENPNFKLVYDKAIIELGFPLSYRDTISSIFDGKGVYSEHNGIRECGSVFVEVDGTGKLLLSDEDTLKNVLRVHSVRTSTILMGKNKLVTEPAQQLDRIEESYKWFARGYRYPILDTYEDTFFNGTEYVCSNKCAYMTIPDSIRAIEDKANEDIIRLDSLKSESRNLDIIQYKVMRSGHIIKVEYSLNTDASLIAFIADPMGIVYQRCQHKGTPGIISSFSFDTKGLRNGDYILYLNVNGNLYSQTIHLNE